MVRPVPTLSADARDDSRDGWLTYLGVMLLVTLWIVLLTLLPRLFA